MAQKIIILEQKRLIFADFAEKSCSNQKIFVTLQPPKISSMDQFKNSTIVKFRSSVLTII